jgi:hypothetical protein
MAVPVTETQKEAGMSAASDLNRERRVMLLSHGPSGSILTADLPPISAQSTLTKRQLHAPLYYFATLSVFLFLYSLIAVEAFIVIGRWQRPYHLNSGICLVPDSKLLAYATDCWLIRPEPRT